MGTPPWCLAVGGTARCPGFRDRLAAELRALVPDDYEVGGAVWCRAVWCRAVMLAQGGVVQGGVAQDVW
jgi:actin-related protein